MKIDQEIRLLKEQVRALSQRIEQRPVVQTIKATQVLYLIIDKGNILDDGSDGIKLSTTLITSIPAYDPNVNTSFVDGIGRAQLVANGEILSGYVLVVNDLRSQWQSALMKTDPIASSGSVFISGQLCYVPV
jgi:hypothetical protein